MIRVRFAPSPTGIMHLGNVRTALLNFLFARQNGGTFIIRIEDTDQQRDFDPGAKNIIADLAWLHLIYDEGPGKNGPHAPYFQSQRTALYQEKLHELEKKEYVYRCFCTLEELEKKRNRQVALKQPPRYDRSCLSLSSAEIQQNLNTKKPFIWRMKVPFEQEVSFNDLARGKISFDLKNFSDFPLTRNDGTFTFIFANCIDDIAMNITHVLRGEDHLSNTVHQLVLYQALNAYVPQFWHQPMIVNTEGKKLSKRDFGFSLHDLQKSGFLPEAIVNYLAIIGGSFEHEIMSLEELIRQYPFNTIHHTGQITYDVEKLRWINHKWIEKLSDSELAQRAQPFIQQALPEAQTADQQLVEKLVAATKTDIHTLQEIPDAISFYFTLPSVTKEYFTEFVDAHSLSALTLVARQLITYTTNADAFLEHLKKEIKTTNVSMKDAGTYIRLALTGKPTGLGLKLLIQLLGSAETKKRLEAAENLVTQPRG